MNDQYIPDHMVSDHPLIIDKLTKLRDVSTSSQTFRVLIRHITLLLLYEGTGAFATGNKTVETPLTDMEGMEIKESIAIVPILRAGLIMSDAVSELLPESPIVHIGLERNEKTLESKKYFSGQLQKPKVTTCLLLDPMLATGGTASTACDIIKSWGVKKIIFIGIIGAPEGFTRLRENHPDVKIHVAAIDSHLDGNGYIVPGLGDAGDRLFSTCL